MESTPRVHTVFLGQFTFERAEALAKEFEEAGIAWWQKQSGGIAKFLFRGDWGVRLFVDSAKSEQVKQIVDRVNARFEEKQK
ncbi:MAG: hypothetical protein ACYDCC_05300 [Actinomycetota bacterium]